MSERSNALSYLASHNVMTLATSGPEGAWAAAVFYANTGFTLYFVSSPKSRHARDIEREPRAAAAIHEDYRDWRAIQGLQLSGNVERLEGEARDAALACYRRKFGFLDNPTAALAPVLAALGKAACYRLTPSELYFIDNAAGFGQRSAVSI
ncbi:MAG: pyridoxamine 5'-phosphate oxidase [Betaproteobacteria bacterium]|nr:MAG: pyridoxamine 5'-phosphate oxidase [Betaproteobacteria bacterium]